MSMYTAQFSLKVAAESNIEADAVVDEFFNHPGIEKALLEVSSNEAYLRRETAGLPKEFTPAAEQAYTVLGVYYDGDDAHQRLTQPRSKEQEALAVIAAEVPTEDTWRSAADFMEHVAATLERYGVVRPERYEDNLDAAEGEGRR